MTSDTRVPKAEITGIYGGLLKVAMRKMLGDLPESAEMMWQNPRVFKDMMGFGRKAEKWDRLDPNLTSFAYMAAAGLVGCSFCLDLHYFMAHNRGLDEAKAREVPRWWESDTFTPLERRVMEYAEAMSQTPPTVTDEMSAALLEELGAPALAESVSIAMLTVLETLGPAERAVFVLREVFDVPYAEIAEAVGKTPAAVRQISHRARRHVGARRPRMER